MSGAVVREQNLTVYKGNAVCVKMFQYKVKALYTISIKQNGLRKYLELTFFCQYEFQLHSQYSKF